MTQIDYGKEQRRLRELYAKMEDGELAEIAAEANSLTDVAREALGTELSNRGMQVPSVQRELGEETEIRRERTYEREARNLGGRESGAPVVIAKYRGTVEAMVPKSILDSAGIESFLINEHLGRLNWHYCGLIDGIQLLVRAQDAETATKLLEGTIPEKFEVPGVGEYAQPRCPKCGSLDIGFDEVDKSATVASIGLLGIPFATTRDGGTCHACGCEWDYDGGPSPE